MEHTDKEYVNCIKFIRNIKNESVWPRVENFLNAIKNLEIMSPDIILHIGQSFELPTKSTIIYVKHNMEDIGVGVYYVGKPGGPYVYYILDGVQAKSGIAANWPEIEVICQEIVK